MHKGDNSYADDFAHNMQIYQEALQHYYQEDYTYFELGDGVELWENKSFAPIFKAYKSIFDLQKNSIMKIDCICFLEITIWFLKIKM